MTFALVKDNFPLRVRTTLNFFQSNRQLIEDYLKLVTACSHLEFSQITNDAQDAMQFFQNKIEEEHLKAFGTPLILDD